MLPRILATGWLFDGRSLGNIAVNPMIKRSPVVIAIVKLLRILENVREIATNPSANRRSAVRAPRRSWATLPGGDGVVCIVPPTSPLDAESTVT
ncbi:hypothetical protein [Nocardia asteroides]|uniref:hypothetical protein n=1 Tax=Nocardia asteroides TaxID=1824 RepID=UPI0033EBE34E